MDASTVFSAASWIATRLIEEGEYLYGVKDQVSSLQDELECMVGFLQQQDLDSSNGISQIGDRQLDIFTDKIRQIAFQAEDVIDTYILKVSSHSQGKSLLIQCACFLSNSILIYQTGNQIEAIIKEAKEASDRLNKYRVEPKGTINEGTSSGGRKSIMLETYAHTEDEIVIGFDDYIRKLVEEVIDENKSWVIGIVGTGGAGKTTLARKVFHHPNVTSCFKYKAWVSISQQWRRRDILYEILRTTRGMNENGKDWTDRELIEKLYYFLKDERYLIVLDDIWDTNAWDEIRVAIPHSTNGSKVVITTRNQQVPKHADPNCFSLEPQLLDNGKDWELFSKIALGGQHSSPEYKNFEILGKEMVGTCGGLPLAIVTLAGLLGTQQTLDEWERICRENILEYGRVDKIIALSYLNLPSRLKPCFLYLAVFPEDSLISGTLLTQLWMAENLVTKDQQRGQETLEDVAKRYLDELVQRCILKVAYRNYAGIVNKYRLHDLLLDFCIKMTKKQSFLEVFSQSNESNPDARGSLPARRAAIHGGHFPTQNSHIRSLIRFGKCVPYKNGYDEMVTMGSVYENFKLLRVLNLWVVKFPSGKLFKEIGNLIHLKYLAIKYTNITMFPKSIGNLKNLLTLDLRYNWNARELNFNLSNLIWIRHLYLDYWDYISKKRWGLEKLKDLQTLKGICGGKWMIKEMGGLSKGIKTLEILYISSKQQLEALYQCPSITSNSIHTLYLSWLDYENLKLELDKLDNCKRLKKMALRGRINEDNPIVKPLQFPPSIVHLQLLASYFKGKDWITTLGQLPYLKFLSLVEDAFDGDLLIIGSGAFPQLETLYLYYLSNLEECRIEEGALACLRSLEIDRCSKFQRLPKALRKITTLQELEINDMPKTFCKRLGWEEDNGNYLQIKNMSEKETSTSTSSKATKHGRESSKKRSGEDVDIIQHIPTIVIRSNKTVNIKQSFEIIGRQEYLHYNDSTVTISLTWTRKRNIVHGLAYDLRKRELRGEEL